MRKSHLFAEPYRAAFNYFLKMKMIELGPEDKIEKMAVISEMWDNLDEEEQIKYDELAREDKREQINQMRKSPMRNINSEPQQFKRRQQEPSEEQLRVMKRLNKNQDEQQDSDNSDEEASKQINTRQQKPRDVIKEQLDEDMKYLQKVNQQRKASKPRISITEFDKQEEEKPDYNKYESKSKQMNKQQEKKTYKDQDSDEELQQMKKNEQSHKKPMKSTKKQQSSSEEEDPEMAKRKKQMKSRYSKKKLDARNEESLIVKDSIEKFIKHFEKCTLNK